MNNSLIKIIQIANETQYYNKIFKDKNIINGLTAKLALSAPPARRFVPIVPLK